MSQLINDCNSAELHLIGKIQSYGILLAFDPITGRVFACSENAGKFLGREAADVIGQHWSQLFQAHEISFEPATDDADQHLPSIAETVLNNIPVVISSHPRRHAIIVEIETRSDEILYDHRARLSFLQDLARATTPANAASLLMKHIATITGFDRVMLYKFMPDWHGKVIDEQNRTGVQGFLGLHFPAGDIPENARRLYVINTQRIIVDVGSSDVNIVAADTHDALDLTHAQLRAVHPVHIQYLKNIGAQTSYSVSIIVAGKLWGMVACHNLEVKPLGFKRRFLCEELARTVSLHMSGLTAVAAEQRRAWFYAFKLTIQATLKTNAILSESFHMYAPQLLQLFSADSFWLNIDGMDFRYGAVTQVEALAELKVWLGKLDRTQVFHSNIIAEELKPFDSLVKYASGILFVPLGERGFAVFCRNEQIENVQWAGGQEPSEHENCHVDPFTPRKSFETWSEQVLGHSIAWHDTELESATQLREVLIDYLEKIKLEQMAWQDGLTGLANRMQFERKLDNAIEVSKSTATIVAVFMLDLDNLKPVNDTWGHSAGDELLIQVGERLKKHVRGRDVVARFGGDEFAVILYHFTVLSEVEDVASRIVEEMRRPFRLKETEVQIGGSLGIALYPEHATDPQELIEKADAALYKVKRSGRNAWRFSDTSSAN